MMNSTGDQDTQILDVSASPVGARESKIPCLTVLKGGRAGMVHALVAGQIALIGRADDADVRIDDHRVSRKHASVTCSNGDVILEDLGSSNGTFVNGIRIEKQQLKEGDSIQIGPGGIVKLSNLNELEQKLQQEVASGLKDPQTGIYSKNFFLDRIEAEPTYAQGHQDKLGLIVFEIDHFTDISNTHGSPAGDFILKEVAWVVGQILRTQDIFARYDGAQFVVLAHDLGDQGAVVLAQRIRRGVKLHRFVFKGGRIGVTVSIGIGTLSDKVKKPVKLINLARNSLNRAKKQGGEDVIGGDAVKTYRQSGGPTK
ncbi:MAG: GGDEF domain-containing protein [Gammaproteobacteria bacterium]|nr:GGDEF domain-containing protein [Gammaproteobacteria bacterium]